MKYALRMLDACTSPMMRCVSRTGHLRSLDDRGEFTQRDGSRVHGPSRMRHPLSVGWTQKSFLSGDTTHFVGRGRRGIARGYTVPGRIAKACATRCYGRKGWRGEAVSRSRDSIRCNKCCQKQKPRAEQERSSNSFRGAGRFLPHFLAHNTPSGRAVGRKG